MEFIPAIDILDGKAVRLAQGDYNQVTVYNDDPVLQAQLFEEAGANWIHIVDLEGARSGSPAILDILSKILERCSLSIEVGGGIRSIESAQRYFDLGVQRIILGTALVKDPELAQEAVNRFGPALACGIDARDGKVAISGWKEASGIDDVELARTMAEYGFEHLIYTDIARDGMQTGIDLGAYRRMASAFGNPVIASGGIGGVADLESLKTLGSDIEGVIAGRAIYEGVLPVQDGVAACADGASIEPMPDFGKPISEADLKGNS